MSEKNIIAQTSLNPQQQQAVLHDKGPLQVIAGAGSGKTRVITSRIAHLMTHHQHLASSIVALTFTNKAANEMKERIAKMIGTEKPLPFIGTFHSYCVRLLKQNTHLLDKPFISILDEDDQKQMIHKILQRNNLHKQISARQVSYHISHMKNANPTISKPLHLMFEHPLVPEIYQAYEEEKRASRCLDFDDLLIETVALFKKNPDFRKQYQEIVRHILIDEYQDTNIVQHELLKLMALAGKELAVDSICAVGDEDQSIYSWRGATITNMLSFKKDFPETTLIKIEQNYRSVQPILDIANHIIKYNTQRNPKELWSDKHGSNRIKLLTCLSEYQEADAVVHLVNIAQKYNKNDHIAVLYRTHAQSRVIEEALLRNSIPYRIIGGIQFYERKEIKDLLAYANLVVNPFDRTSLFRVINTPARNLGPKFEEQFHAKWHSEPFLGFKRVALDLIDAEALPPAKHGTLKQFIGIFDTISATDKPSAVIEHIISQTQYMTYLKDNHEPEDAQSRIANVRELIDAIKHLESKGIDTLTAFLDEVRLMHDALEKSHEGPAHVLLMTLHAAKGLEFDVVIIPGLEEGILPSARTLPKDDPGLEEERRLFYVGITRAKERLLLTHTKHRYIYGKMVDQAPSKFLSELPRHGIGSQDCSYWNGGMYRQFFADWLDLGSAREVSFTPSQQLPPKQSPAPAIARRITSEASAPASLGGAKTAWKKNQVVKHKEYGTGLVQEAELKPNNTWHVTVKFRSVVKKIVSTFLEKI